MVCVYDEFGDLNKFDILTKYLQLINYKSAV
jgi:hypothetical protein